MLAPRLGHKVVDVSKPSSESSPNVLALLDSEPDVVSIGTWQNLVIVVWHAGATVPAVARLSAISRSMKAQHPERVTHVHIIPDRAGLPTSEARSDLTALLKELGEHIANVAVVVGGTGFWASTMRSMITGMRFLSPRAFDLQLHATVTEIVDWLPKAHLTRTGVVIAPTELHRVLRLAELWPLDAGPVEPLWEPADVDHR